jgi:hypothetical protein
MHPEPGSPILPIYCLFLLSLEKVLLSTRRDGYLKAGKKEADT